VSGNASLTFTGSARTVGERCAYAITGLTAIYAVVLAVGFYRLPSPDVSISGVLLTILELLILVLAPTIVALMVALHAWAPRRTGSTAGSQSLDILARDVFFPIGACCAALVLRREPRARPIARILLISALFAFAGLSGVLVHDMQWRNIGIVGYAVVFPVGGLPFEPFVRAP